ncbi:CAP domain-containing protein [Leptolyngbya sp. FACHB-321]|nr:CAP domain-containing protein [Leptolyngbya sp. FACHB-321]
MRYRARPKATAKQIVATTQRYVLPVLLAVATVAYYARDAYYFDNGKGGQGWRIGQPKASLFNANNTRSLPQLRQFALSLVNCDRQLNGLPPLVEDPLLSQAAQQHSQDMLTRRYYAHITPEGKTPTDRLAQLGGKGGVGENIMQQTGSMGVSLNYGLLERFQKSWMYSKGHRQNLLKPDYTRFGYGIVVDPLSGQTYAAQGFALPAPP